MDNLSNNRSEIERIYRDQIRRDGLKQPSVSLEEMVPDYRELIEEHENSRTEY